MRQYGGDKGLGRAGISSLQYKMYQIYHAHPATAMYCSNHPALQRSSATAICVSTEGSNKRIA